MAIYKGDQRILGIGVTGDYAGATVLWENPDPTAAMDENTVITLSSDNYDILDVYVLNTVKATEMFISSVLKGNDIPCNYASDSGHNFGRVLIRSSDTSYNADKARSDSSGVTNDFCVPLKIIGKKLGTNKPKILESVLTSDVTVNYEDTSTCPLTLQPGMYFLSVRNISEVNAWIGANGKQIQDQLDPMYMIIRSYENSSMLINIDTETTFSIANGNGQAVTYMKGTYIKAYKLN